MTDGMFCAKCLSQYQEILSKTRLFGTGKYSKLGRTLYFIPSSEFNAYLKQIKVLLSAVKKYRIFSLVTGTIYIFSL